MPVRELEPADLESVNEIIASCVQGWDLPDRVKRLSMNSYLYQADDIDFLVLYVSEDDNKIINGVIALQYDLSVNLPGKRRGLLIHGLYVSPDSRNQGVGRALTEVAMQRAREQGFEGVWVKAQADANAYFEHNDFEKLPVIDPQRDYPHRWWKPVN